MKFEIKVPSVGESVSSAMIGAWQKSSGDYVDKNEILVLLETDKASVEVPSESAGELEILKKDGTEVKIGEVIGRIDESKQGGKKTTSEKKSKAKNSSTTSQKSPIEKKEQSSSSSVSDGSPTFDPSKFSPAVRHQLMEKNIDPSTLQGTGKEGRIKKSDVITPSFVQKPSLPKMAPSVTPSFSEDTEVRKEKMTTIRKRIAERLVASQHHTATLTTFNEIDMSRIISLRKEYQELFQKKYSIKLGFMGFFIKAVIQALKAYPRVGTQMVGDDLVFHKHCHINIAVSTDKGLIVPVIRYADQMSIANIEKHVLHLAKKARDGQIRPDDLVGGIFTISNGGVFGSLLSTPILNPPQSGILGMHKIEKRPVVMNNEIAIRPMMYMALSYDHRIVDGKESVGFLVTVKQCIEEPSRMLLDI